MNRLNSPILAGFIAFLWFAVMALSVWAVK